LRPRFLALAASGDRRRPARFTGIGRAVRIGHLTLRANKESISNNVPVSGDRSPESDTFERDRRCGMRVDCYVEVNSHVFCSLRNY